MSRNHVIRAFTVIGLLALAPSLPAQKPAPTPKPSLPSEMPVKFTPVTTSFDYDRRTVMIPMRDGVKLFTVILVPRGAKGAGMLLTRTPYDADAMTSQSAELAPRPDARGLRQRDRRHRRGRLHPRRAGRARQARLRGGLRDEPAAARAAQPDGGGPRDRHVRHDRLAREERPGVQREGRHPRHLLRRLHAADGALQPAPGAEGLRADEPDGRRLDGRRLVPQRRIPAARSLLHLRAGGRPQERA